MDATLTPQQLQMLLDAEVQLLIQVETLEAAIARAIAIVETVKAKDTE